MKWNNEAKECQVCTLLSLKYFFFHIIPLQDLHGRGLFDDHVRNAAVHRCVVGRRESKGRAGLCCKQSHSTNVGEVGEQVVRHHHHHHHHHHEQVKNIMNGFRADMKVIGLGNLTGAEEA